MNFFKAHYLTWKLCAFKGFNSDQQHQIYRGFEKYNLTKEQVEVYANPMLKYSIMAQIRRALAKGAQIEEVKYWVSKNLSYERWYLVLQGLDKGFTREQIAMYAENSVTENEAFFIFCNML